MEKAWQHIVLYKNPSQDITTRFNSLRYGLKKCSKNLSHLGKIIDNTSYVIAIMDGLEDQRDLSTIEKNFRKSLKAHMLKLLVERRIYWSNRAKIKWAKLGDENTKKIHAVATRNYSHNYISSLLVVHENRITEHDQKASILWHSFKDRLGVFDNMQMLINIVHLIVQQDFSSLEVPFLRRKLIISYLRCPMKNPLDLMVLMEFA